MTIISISLTHKLSQELDELKDDIGFSVFLGVQKLLEPIRES